MDRPGPDAALKICDFGMARYYNKSDQEEIMHTSVGTPIYMAPELAQGSGYSANADLWSMGVILLDLLVYKKLYENKRPFVNKNNFVYAFANRKVDLAEYGFQVSDLCLDLLRGLVAVDPADRLSLPQFFEHPFVATEPSVYEREYNPRLPREPVAAEEAKQEPRLGISSHLEEKLVDIFAEDLKSLMPDSDANLVEARKFRVSLDLTRKAVEMLHHKAQFLEQLLGYELDDQENSLTCETYPFETELRFMTFQLTRELKAVIEIFSAQPFLSNSNSRESDENEVDVQIKNQEMKQLAQIILNSKNSEFESRCTMASIDPDHAEQPLQKLRLLLADSLSASGISESAVPVVVEFSEHVMAKLKEVHGPALTPLIQSLQQSFISLSKYLLYFQNDISKGAIANPKRLGRNLQNQVLWLCEQAAKLELDQNFKAAHSRFSEALFLVHELQRLNYNHHKLMQPLPADEQHKFQDQGLRNAEALVASFSFLAPAKDSIFSGESEGSGLFDVKADEVFFSLSSVVSQQLKVVKAHV